MAWLDDQGISQDGEPPHDHQMLGGRWYPVEAASLASYGLGSVHRDFDLLAVC